MNARLDTGPGGLTVNEAQRRLLHHGRNELAFHKTPAWLRLLRQFNDPMVIILLITAAVTATLTALGSHMLPDTLVIIGVVVLNALLGFIQEGHAEGALDALREMMVQEARVKRDGELQQIAAAELVPGDLVALESGDCIPADVRFVESANTHVDESALTGESIPVLKHTRPLDDAPLVPGDQRNVGFSGTYVTRGSALAVVVATGRGTVFGQIADIVSTSGHGPTPLQRKIREFVRTLIKAILLVGAVNFALGLLLAYPVSYSFLGTVSLVVAAIPEMLPALVTSVLAISGMAMASRKALVRNLPAAETLGATSVICSDKTGTLTENRMTVTRVQAAGQVYHLNRQADAAIFEADSGPVAALDLPALRAVLQCGHYCNNARVSGSGHGVGDPTELALRGAGHLAGLPDEGAKRLDEIPFDSATKYMAVLVELDGRRLILAKGAPEFVVAMCDRQMTADGGDEPLSQEPHIADASEFAGDALRTLGFALRLVPPDQTQIKPQDLQQMCFLGLQGMIDPPRPSAIDAVRLCRGAGIRTVMITGDHPNTAQAVARQLGIAADRVVTGTELIAIEGDIGALRELTEEVSVFARVAPEHKRAIAVALQQNGHVVAMTGDGVNDAPALKAADIGIAMGIGGTEVARQAADMVLADDNFATIVAAVEEGRHAWNNLQKAILYTLPTNAAQALLIMGAILLAAFVPLFATRFVLEPVQILWINLLDSVLLTMPLMMEAKERHLLEQPPRSPQLRIITPLFIRRVVVMGLSIALPGFLIYYHFGAAAVVDGRLVDELLLTQAQTAAFWAILLAHIGYVISARSVHTSAFRINPLSNLWLLGGIGLSILIRFIPTAIPEAAVLFRTAEFPAEWWPLIMLCLLPSFIAIELDKAWHRRIQA